MDKLEAHKADMIKSLEYFKDWSTFPRETFIDAIRKATTHQELSDLDQCLDTWRYGY